jgi:hypothetical protein
MANINKVIAEKKAEIELIDREQKELIKQATKLLKKPYKRSKTFMAKMIKAAVLIARVKVLEANKLGIAAKPVPKFPPGAKQQEGEAVVGDAGREKIILPTLTGSKMFELPENWTNAQEKQIPPHILFQSKQSEV